MRISLKGLCLVKQLHLWSYSNWSPSLRRIQCSFQDLWGWTSILLTSIRMRKYGSLWSIPIWKPLSLGYQTNLTTSVVKEERTSGMTSFKKPCTFQKLKSIKDKIVATLCSLLLVWVSGSSCVWPELCWGKPKFWFWMRPQQPLTWRQTTWFRRLSVLSLRTVRSWQSRIALTQSWTTAGTMQT